MDTTENNKLIAEFMGWEYNNCNIPLSLRLCASPMVAVEKIESILDEHGCAKYNVRIEQCWVDIIDNRKSDEIVQVGADSKEKAMWKAIVEFIKWYNKNKVDECNKWKKIGVKKWLRKKRKVDLKSFLKELR